ncbi:ABC transporter permease [Alkalihalobacillus sp. FSL W8-0930]
MFLSLMQNEWTKAYYRNKFLIFSIVMVALLFVGVAGTLFFQNFDFGDDIPAIQVEPVGFAVGAVDTLFVFVLIFSIVMLISGIATEYKSGTMKQLLIRPISRTQILLSKWVTIYLVTIGIFVGIAILSLLIGYVFFDSNTAFGESVSTLFQLILYRLPMLFFYQVLALLLAILTRSTALALSPILILHFTGSIVMVFLERFEWSKFIIIPNLNLLYYSSNELIQYPGGPYSDGMTLGFSLAVIAVYSIILLVIAHLVFKKKDVLS